MLTQEQSYKYGRFARSCGLFQDKFRQIFSLVYIYRKVNVQESFVETLTAISSFRWKFPEFRFRFKLYTIRLLAATERTDKTDTATNSVDWLFFFGTLFLQIIGVKSTLVERNTRFFIATSILSTHTIVHNLQLFTFYLSSFNNFLIFFFALYYKSLYRIISRLCYSCYNVI